MSKSYQSFFKTNSAPKTGVCSWLLLLQCAGPEGDSTSEAQNHRARRLSKHGFTALFSCLRLTLILNAGLTQTNHNFPESQCGSKTIGAMYPSVLDEKL